ncbi:MAG: TonB-dependent receptor [Pseudomonadota bacterium]
MMLKRYVLKKLFLIFFFLVFSANSFAAQSEVLTNDLLDLPLNTLLNMKVTSVSKKEQKLSQAAAAIYVISNEDIRRSGATSIADVLPLAPGIQVAKLGSHKWAISSRGSNGIFANKLLVLLDGRSLYSTTFSGVPWNVVDTPLEDIQRVEVIHGPGATLWGSNAVNGVINIITKKAIETNGTLLSIGTGNYEKLFAQVRIGEIFSEQLAGRAYLKFQAKESYQLYSDNSDASDQWDNWRSGFKLDGTISDGEEWTVQGDIYQSHEKQAVFLQGHSADNPVINAIEEPNPSGWNLLGKWEKQLKSKSKINLQLYFDHNETENVILGQNQTVFDVDFQYQFNLANIFAKQHQLLWGASYRHIRDKFKNGQIQLQQEHQQYDLFRGFIQDEITIIPQQLHLTLGTEVEYHDITGFEYQPSIRLAWMLSDKQTAWAAISRAVRTPARAAYNSQALVTINNNKPVVFNIFNTIKPEAENLLAYELGLRNQINPRTYMDASLFYHHMSHLYSLTPLAYNQIPSFQGGYERASKTYGIEMVFNWNVNSWWKLLSSYTYTRSLIDVSENETINLNSHSDSLPEHQLSIRSQMNIAKNLEFDIWTIYIDELNDSSLQAQLSNIIVDAYTRVNVHIAWQASKNFEITLAGKDLFSGQHLEFVGEIYTQPTQVGPSVYAQLRWTID